MAILGELAELEIQQRNRDKEREAGGECVRNKNSKQADTHTHTSLLTVKLPSSLSPLFSCEDEMKLGEGEGRGERRGAVEGRGICIGRELYIQTDE